MWRTPLLLVATVSATLAITPELRAGYTHYFTWRLPPAELRLQACIQDMERVIAAAKNLLAGPTGTGAPIIEALRVELNGREEDAHEPFVFPGMPAFNFCKTMHKPYDAAITACLLVARDHFPPDTLEIKSDGNWQDGDWMAGARLYQSVFARPAVNPMPPSARMPLRTDEEEGRGRAPRNLFLIGPATFLVGSLLAGLAVLYWASGPRYALVVSIEDGFARVSQGQVKPALMEEVNEICTRNGLRRGNIWGIRAKKRVSLRFSRHFPENCRQQIRNVWALHT